MPPQHDILLKGATVVDPVNNRHAVMDVAVAGGRIADILPEMDSGLADESIDLSGFYLIPGIIDLHVHASSWLGGRYGHKMMALAGVTTALDMSGTLEAMATTTARSEAGSPTGCFVSNRPGLRPVFASGGDG